jgi:ADP-ribosyl-[dinitrogen reductase] hydrolase
MNKAILQDKYRGALLGLAIGDALGTTLEFTRHMNPWQPKVTSIVGGGPFALKAGDFTDDASMALCMAESLVACRGFAPTDQAARYLRWWKRGENSVKGYCFDIGGTTSAALRRFVETGKPYAGVASGGGNGSLMRLVPVVLAYARDEEAAIDYAGKSSMVTHGAPEAVDACRFYARLIVRALNGADKATLLEAWQADGLNLCSKIDTVARGSYKHKGWRQISGSGYVVNSLEAALWAIDNSDTYRDAIILAANLGEDADTTAAVAGQLAGALYGLTGIPSEWVEALTWRERFLTVSDRLFELAGWGAA